MKGGRWTANAFTKKEFEECGFRPIVGASISWLMVCLSVRVENMMMIAK